MTLEILQSEKMTAMKNKDERKKRVVSEMIDHIQKAAITPKGRIEITDQLVDEVLIKYQKMVQEMIDTCPGSRPETLAEYKADMEVVKEFAPQLLTDPVEIRAMIFTITSQANIELITKNRGTIMKTITPYFKGKADMKIVSQVVTEIIE